jgi:molybdopterin synthase catalytic subunit
VKVTIRCFASVRELLGRDVVELDIADGTTVAGVKAKLAERAPDLLRLPLAHAVNRAYAAPDRVLQDGDELALIPPISGGSPHADRFRFDLVRESIDPRALEDEVRTDADGAVVAFAGVTRDHNDGQAVRGLSYEAYDAMVHEVMERVLADVVARHEVGKVRVAHRLGEVPIGAASVVVVVAAAHRAPAFAACAEIMDRLKAEAPIFKKEWLAGADGASRWVGDLPRPGG